VTSDRRAALLVVLLALVAGVPSLFAGFIHDDHRIIEENTLIRSLGNTAEIFRQGYWTVDARAVPNLYRPLTILSFALNHAAGGLQPLGYRLVDLLLHGLVALLVLRLFRRVLGAPGEGPGLDAALCGALLFAVHPVHTEALGLVVGRSELLAAVFCLAAVLCFLRGVDRAATGGGAGEWLWYGASLGCVAAGFLSKENAVAAPFLVLAADWTRPWMGRPARPADRPRNTIPYHAASAALMVLLLVIRSRVLGGISPAGFTHFVDNPIASLPFVEGRLTALKVIARYAALLVLPVRLSIDHSYDAIRPATSMLDPGAIAGGIVLLAVTAGILASRRRRPEIAFGGLVLGLSFLPVANLLLPIGTIMAERLLYLPSVGFCLLFGAILARAAAEGAGHSTALRAGVGLAIALLTVMSLARLREWRDDRTIFAAAIAVEPRSVRAQFNYGVASESAGDAAAAERAYLTALSIWDDFSDAHYNLAGLLAKREDWAGAIGHYRAALRDQPGNVSYLVNLGHSLNRAGRPGEALEPLERAVSLDAASDRGLTDLGAAYMALQRPDDAARVYREAVRLDGRNPDYLINLGLAEESRGAAAAAVDAYGAAAALRPGDAILRYRWGRALEQAGRLDAAADAYRESSRLAPASPVPLRQLGLLLLARGDRDGALQSLERASSLDPSGSVMDAAARRALEDLHRSPGGRAPRSPAAPPAPGRSPARG
jgi:tetratricopeptide (TPR) repeat protein